MPLAKYHTTHHLDATHSVSRWSAYLYQSRRDASAVLHGSVTRIAGGLLERSPRSRDLQAESRRVRELADAFGREVFSRLYDGDVEALDRPAAGTDLLVKAHGMLTDLPEWESLRSQVHGDPDLSAITTATLLDKIATALPSIREQEKQQAQEQGREETRRSRRTRGPKADPDGALRRALRGACASAQEVQAQVRSGLGGVAPGMEATPAVHDQDGTDRMELAERVSTDPRLRKVMELAGRLRRIADSGRKVRDNLGADTLVGVTIGGDLPRVLPAELVLLRHPRLRRIQLAKLADRRMAQYHLQGETPQGRGPVVVLLDESGSMSGDRSMWASAVALACMGIAARESRSCTVIGFNSGIRYAVHLDKAGKSWTLPTANRYALDLERSPIALGDAGTMAVHIATSSPSGGTNFSPAFQAALDLEEGVTQDRADLILVTDGQATIAPEQLERVQESRERGLRVFGLTVGGGSLGHAVRQLCDTTADLDSMDGEEVASAIP